MIPGASLVIKDLAVCYGAVEAVSGASLSLESGQIVALLGANGAGKSSLIKAVIGLTKATGSVHVDGVERLGWRPDEAVRAGCVVVPEGRGIIGSITVEENLELGAYWRTSAEMESEKLRVWGLFPVLKERQKQAGGMLSGGEQQMLAIGRALMAAPKLLILDEPTMGLSPIKVSEVLSVIDAVRRSGVSILIVEQNAAAALDIAQSAVILANGRVVAAGSASDIAQDRSLFRLYMT